jgi:N utilization substance protein B
MGARTTAREAALMLLFATDGVKDASLEELLVHFWRTLAPDAGLSVDPESRAYAEEITRGALGAPGKVDGAIKAASTNWRLERMSRVDRNVLRIGAWELLHGAPRAVVIDEAIELGKRYGTEDSGAFVNGVLERIATTLGAK